MFVQVIQGRIADADELRASMDHWLRDLAPGAIAWLGSTGGVTSEGMAIAVVRFESEEGARRNSERPEQHQWWMETAKLYAGDVTFHDCREVYEFGQGNFDQAGFVQIMQGRFVDRQRALEQFQGMEQATREMRPDVLGGTLCLHGDGGFTQPVYFTSEAEARIGEGRDMPPDMRSRIEEMQANTTDLTYYDLSNPWLDSPR